MSNFHLSFLLLLLLFYFGFKNNITDVSSSDLFKSLTLWFHIRKPYCIALSEQHHTSLYTQSYSKKMTVYYDVSMLSFKALT